MQVFWDLYKWFVNCASVLYLWKCFGICGSVLDFMQVFCDFWKCFVIFGSVLDLCKCFGFVQVVCPYEPP